jgi:hypothetical protein
VIVGIIAQPFLCGTSSRDTKTMRKLEAMLIGNPRVRAEIEKSMASRSLSALVAKTVLANVRKRSELPK